MTETLTAAEYRKQASKPKRSKYGNRKVVIDGRKYDSNREAEYCEGLIVCEKAGAISGLEFQRRFPLLGPKGELIATYIADACFIDTEGKFRCQDVKGVITKEFRLKRKMMRALLGIEVEIVK